MGILKFPPNFLWGTVTSAYQVEGGIENNDWAKDYPAGRACDHYNRYEGDFDWLKKLNQNAYRFSVEWSRIEPEEGRFNKKEIDHYKEVVLALKKRGITPFVTLNHYTVPLWLFKKAGAENKKTAEYFSRYVKIIAENFRASVDFWLTINEPVLGAVGEYLLGFGPPKQKSLLKTIRVVRNLIKFHKDAYKIIRKICPNARVGAANNLIYFEPARSNSLLDKLSVYCYRYFWNSYFLDAIREHQDLIGLNYYFRNKIKFPFSNKNENKVVSDLGWEVYPEGIYYVLKELQRYRKPIYITENGLADAEDRLRSDFIKDHLYWTYKAIEEGVDVRGYFHWSLFDNFEWDKGFEPRFGLIEIDYKTLERKPRPSAYYYGQICKDNYLKI